VVQRLKALMAAVICPECGDMRVLYVCNDMSYFDAHRRWLADAARAAGATVFIASGGVTRGAPNPPDFALDVERHRLDLKRDYALARRIAKITEKVKPDVVHLITIKPVLFGSLGLAGVSWPRRIVATFPGLGRVFDQASDSPKASIRRHLVVQGLKRGFKTERVRAIFEKEHDRDVLLSYGVIAPERAVHIAGAGVDQAQYLAAPLPEGRLRILFASRIIHSKGVMEVAEAASLAAAAGADVEVLIAGDEQPNDPDRLSQTDMDVLRSNPHVTLLGRVPAERMPALITSCHAVILPTRYQEGVPRILIEAASVGRALIVSDNPGCTALVNGPEAGVVLPAATPQAIADAFMRLAVDKEAVRRMAAGAQQRFVAGGFSSLFVRDATLKLYEA
jgi:glycosyltransferase involved in cell wall biosynthesis